jgi:hypothetical protein
MGNPAEERLPPSVTGEPKLVLVVKHLACLADLVTVAPTARHSFNVEFGHGAGSRPHTLDPYGVQR